MKRRKLLFLMARTAAFMFALVLAHVLLTGISGRVSMALFNGSGRFPWVVWLALVPPFLLFAYNLFRYGKAACHEWRTFQANRLRTGATESLGTLILRYPNLSFALFLIFILILSALFFALNRFLPPLEETQTFTLTLAETFLILAFFELLAWKSLVSDLKRLRNARAATRSGKVKWLFRYTNLTAAVFLVCSFAFYVIVTELFRCLYSVPYLSDALFLIRYVPLGLAIFYTASKDEWQTFKEKYVDSFIKPMGEERKYWNQDGKPLQSEDSQEERTVKRFSIFQVRQMLRELSGGGRLENSKPFVTLAVAFLAAYAVLVILFARPIFVDFIRNFYKLAAGMYASLFGSVFEHDPETVAVGLQDVQSAFFAHALDALFLFLISWGVFIGLTLILYVIVMIRRRKKKIRFFNPDEETPEEKDGD